jgi:hypothetical protein
VGGKILKNEVDSELSCREIIRSWPPGGPEIGNGQKIRPSHYVHCAYAFNSTSQKYRRCLRIPSRRIVGDGGRVKVHVMTLREVMEWIEFVGEFV